MMFLSNIATRLGGVDGEPLMIPSSSATYQYSFLVGARSLFLFL
jgi:hypothetical protein